MSVVLRRALFDALQVIHGKANVRPVAVRRRLGVFAIANQINPLLFTWYCPFERLDPGFFGARDAARRLPSEIRRTRVAS